MAPRSLIAAAAALLVVLLAATPSALAATDCIGALLATNGACGAEIASVRDGAVPNSVSPACCRSASAMFAPNSAFNSDCACSSAVAPYRSLLKQAASAVASKCGAAAQASALKSCGENAVSPSNSAVSPAAPPAWGTGSICTSQSTRGCRTKCTPRAAGANPSATQITSAERCASTTQGFCNGLGGDPATGTTVCRKGFVVPDESPRNGVSRKCFRCCTPGLAPVGNRAARNACANPNANQGGRGGGGGGGGCFPGDATVVVEGGRSVPLRDVKIGDRVLSVSPETGEPTYETVYFFGHQLPQAAAEFVRLKVAAADATTTTTTTLELTHKHLVPVAQGDAPSLASAVYTRAMDVRVGDKVLLVDAAASEPRLAHVTAAQSVARPSGAGLFAPLTTGGGHIVVDGVVASVHSNNMLDPLAEFLGRRDLLQWAYESFGASVLKSAYRLVGADAMAKASPIVAGLGLGDGAQLAAGLRGLVASASARVHKSA
jgi:hypothetical protein